MEQESKDLIKSIIIGLAAVGAIVFIGAVAPNIFKILRNRKFIKGTLKKNKFNNAIYYLKNKNIIQIKDNKNGACTVNLTKKGKQKTLQYNIDDMKIKPMKKWDGKWRFVMFDIPDKHRKASNALREKLKELGFLQFQKSIWVHPYLIEDEIEFIAGIFNVRRFIRMGEIVNLDGDNDLRTKFELSKLN